MFKGIHGNKIGLIPSLLLLGGSIFLLSVMAKNPTWPLHFRFDGSVDRYGGSRELWSMVLFNLCFIVAMACLDEGMLLSGKRKYNFAGAISAFISGIFFMTILQIYQTGIGMGKNSYVLVWMLGTGLAVGLAAYLLEWFRRYPAPEIDGVKSAPEPESDDDNWFYWEHFNPWWLNSMLICVCVGMVGMSLFLPDGRAVVEVTTLVSIPILLLFTGGIYFSLNRERLTVRLGQLKIPCLTLKTVNIKAVEVVQFNPIRDFGGWGIRYGIKLGWGFILGNRGIKLETQSGRRITVSLKNPDLVARLLSSTQSACNRHS